LPSRRRNGISPSRARKGSSVVCDSRIIAVCTRVEAATRAGQDAFQNRHIQGAIFSA
jgi:hypothetical protein